MEGNTGPLSLTSTHPAGEAGEGLVGYQAVGTAPQEKKNRLWLELDVSARLARMCQMSVLTQCINKRLTVRAKAYRKHLATIFKAVICISVFPLCKTSFHHGGDFLLCNVSSSFSVYRSVPLFVSAF